MPAAFLVLLALSPLQAQTVSGRTVVVPTLPSVLPPLALPQLLFPPVPAGGTFSLPAVPGALPAPGASALPAPQVLAGVVQDYLAGLPAVDPQAASGLGLREADGRLTAFDRESAGRRSAFFRRIARRLEALPAGELGPEEAVDRLLFLAEVWKAAKDAREGPEIEDLLAEPLETVSNYLLKEHGTSRQRARAALSGLEGYPRLLRQLRRLKEPPSGLERRTALQDVEGARDFVRVLGDDLARRLPRQAGRARRAAASALLALDRFAEGLRDLPTKRRGWARGRRKLEASLREHGVGGSLAELKAAALAEAWRAEKEMEALERPVYPGMSRHRAKRAAEGEPLPVGAVLEAYRRSVREARRHLERTGVVTPPRGDRLEVVQTPEYLRSVLPEAAYEGPLPLDRTKTGHVFITLPASDASPEEVREWGRVYATPGAIALTAVHEADPGHHLQGLRQKESPSVVRRIIWDVVSGEGWAHYGEGVMADTGFFPGSRRFSVLYERLWHAVRARAAIGLHAEGWGLERAARYLRRRLKIPVSEAARAARSYALMDPMDSMSYTLGRLEWLRLKEETRRRLGPRFSEKEFHDRALAYGAVPFPYLKEALERDWR